MIILSISEEFLDLIHNQLLKLFSGKCLGALILFKTSEKQAFRNWGKVIHRDCSALLIETKFSNLPPYGTNDAPSPILTGYYNYSYRVLKTTFG